MNRRSFIGSILAAAAAPAIVRAESLMKMAPSGLLAPTWLLDPEGRGAIVFDDYEEGVWRPTVGDSQIIHAHWPARYVRLGRIVTVQFEIAP